LAVRRIETDPHEDDGAAHADVREVLQFVEVDVMRSLYHGPVLSPRTRVAPSTHIRSSGTWLACFTQTAS
jgi:hypothetical protein